MSTYVLIYLAVGLVALIISSILTDEDDDFIGEMFIFVGAITLWPLMILIDVIDFIRARRKRKKDGVSSNNTESDS